MAVLMRSGSSPDRLLAMYAARVFDEVILLPDTVHTGEANYLPVRDKEAVAVGTAAALEDRDQLVTTRHSAAASSRPHPAHGVPFVTTHPSAGSRSRCAGRSPRPLAEPGSATGRPRSVEIATAVRAAHRRSQTSTAATTPGENFGTR